MTSLRDSVLTKARESAETSRSFFADQADRIVACAEALAAAFDAGGRLFTMGNGGSACDAEHVAVEFMHPVFAKRPPLPALSIAQHTALLSAIGNDQDFALAFRDPLKTLARKGDVALALSTSGQSANVNRALTVARELGMLTIGFTGKDGGRMRELCAHCFTVPSYSIHRIQETHVTLLHVLWDLVHIVRGEEDAVG